MESRYDSTKIEMSWLADAMNNRLAELEALRNRTQYLDPAKSSRVCAGALVVCRRQDKLVRYLIIEGGEGRSVPLEEGAEVLCVSLQAPICRAMLGLRKGSRFRFRQDEMEIVDME